MNALRTPSGSCSRHAHRCGPLHSHVECCHPFAWARLYIEPPCHTGSTVTAGDPVCRGSRAVPTALCRKHESRATGDPSGPCTPVADSGLQTDSGLRLPPGARSPRGREPRAISLPRRGCRVWDSIAWLSDSLVRAGFATGERVLTVFSPLGCFCGSNARDRSKGVRSDPMYHATRGAHPEQRRLDGNTATCSSGSPSGGAVHVRRSAHGNGCQP